MQLNFLGKAFIASVGLYAGSKIIESLVQEEQAPVPQHRLLTGQELLDKVGPKSGQAFADLLFTSIVTHDWVRFNQIIDITPAFQASYEQRCEMWRSLRS